MTKLELGADVKTLDPKGNWSTDAPEIEVALGLHSMMTIWRESQQPESIRRHKAMMRKFNMEFGRPANYRPPLSESKIPIKPEQEEKYRLQKESRIMAKDLPAFNKQTSEKWYKASLPLFYSRYGEEFQNHKVFSRFVQIGQKIANKSQKKLRSQVRKYIKERILKAFKRIAPEVQSKIKN